jgi:hypothetical protein
LVEPIHERHGLFVSPVPKIIKQHPDQVASTLNFLLIGYNMSNTVDAGVRADIHPSGDRGSE